MKISLALVLVLMGSSSFAEPNCGMTLWSQEAKFVSPTLNVATQSRPQWFDPGITPEKPENCPLPLAGIVSEALPVATGGHTFFKNYKTGGNPERVINVDKQVVYVIECNDGGSGSFSVDYEFPKGWQTISYSAANPSAPGSWPTMATYLNYRNADMVTSGLSQDHYFLIDIYGAFNSDGDAYFLAKEWDKNFQVMTDFQWLPPNSGIEKGKWTDADIAWQILGSYER